MTWGELIRRSHREYLRYWRLVSWGYVPEDLGSHQRMRLAP
jgi:hypothetical protein